MSFAILPFLSSTLVASHGKNFLFPVSCRGFLLSARSLRKTRENSGDDLSELSSFFSRRLLRLACDAFRSSGDEAALRRVVEIERRALRSLGFRVPQSLDRRTFDRRMAASRRSGDGGGQDDLAGIYASATDEEERRERLIWDKLETLDQKRFFVNKYRVGPGDLSANSPTFDDALESLVTPSNLLHSLLVDEADLNSLYGLRFGQPIVVDLGLPYRMQQKELRSFYSQMKELYALNQILREPFNLFLCNLDASADDSASAGLLSHFPDFLWNVSSRCFSELFPLERLVYLTPDSPDVVGAAGGFRHEDVFVLGACVDSLEPTRNVTYEKAERLGIRSARLDLNTYFSVGGKGRPIGSRKSLNKDSFLALSDVFAVIVDARESEGDWRLAHRNLLRGRKQVLGWRPEQRDFEKRIAELRFERILESVRKRTSASN